MSDFETLMADAERRIERTAANAAENFAGMPRADAIAGMYAQLEESDITRDQLCTTAAIGLRRLHEGEALAERYRLAWTSARGRALDHLYALEESDEERDYLTDELHAEEQECRRYRIAWTSARKRAAMFLAVLRTRGGAGAS